MAKDENEKNYDVMTKIEKDKNTGELIRHLVVEYHNEQDNPTTKLNANITKLKIIDGFPICEAEVSWQGENDNEMIYYNPKNREMKQGGKHYSIMIQFDFREGNKEKGRPITDPRSLEFLITKKLHDSNYTQALMEGMLAENRVDKYMQEGLKDNSKKPCGNYIGAIKENGGRIFYGNIGEKVHEGMKAKRFRNNLSESAKANQVRIEQLKEAIKNINKSTNSLNDIKLRMDLEKELEQLQGNAANQNNNKNIENSQDEIEY